MKAETATLPPRVALKPASDLAAAMPTRWAAGSHEYRKARTALLDAAVDRAVKAGATIVMPVADQFWGDRYGVVKDPFGHKWSIATPRPDAPRTAAELKEAAKGVFG